MLQLSWTNESDKKIEVKHELTTDTFDLDGKDKLLIDLYLPSNVSPNVIGMFDSIFDGGNGNDPWHPIVNPIILDSWFTAEFDISGDGGTMINVITAFVFEQLETTSGSLYVDNMRLQETSSQPPSPTLVQQGNSPTSVEPAADGQDLPGLVLAAGSSIASIAIPMNKWYYMSIFTLFALF